MANMTEFDTGHRDILKQHSNVSTDRLNVVPDYIKMVRDHFQVGGIFKGSATQHVIRFEADFSDNANDHAVKMYFEKYPVDDVAIVLHRSDNIGPPKEHVQGLANGDVLEGEAPGAHSDDDSDTGEGGVGHDDYLVYDDGDRVQHVRDFSIRRMRSKWFRPEGGVHDAIDPHTRERLCDPAEWRRAKAPTAPWVLPGSTSHSQGTYFKSLHSEFEGDKVLNNMPKEGEAQKAYLDRMNEARIPVLRTPMAWLLEEGRKRRNDKGTMDKWKAKLESFAGPGFGAALESSDKHKHLLEKLRPHEALATHTVASHAPDTKTNVPHWHQQPTCIAA